MKKILVTGGAGYVGCALIHKLLKAGYDIKVLDLYIYGTHVFDSLKNAPHLEQVKGDIRDRKTLQNTLQGCDGIIHLACISNDPSFDLNPQLGKSVNYDAFLTLLMLPETRALNALSMPPPPVCMGCKKKKM